MAIPLYGKIALVILTLGVIAAITIVIVLSVRSNNKDETTTTDVPTTDVTTTGVPTTDVTTTGVPTTDVTTTDVTTTDVTTTDVTTTDATNTEEPIQGFQAGVGIADMTGPCAGIRFMGYASLTQKGAGIHLRQFARSFIFVNGNTRVVYISAEIQSVGIAVRREVVRRLQSTYGDLYNIRNVIIAGTHTHSAPGGHLVDFLLDISILGFSRETFNAYVEGITRSVIRAHNNIAPVYLYYGKTKVTNASVNRSPFSYLQNPQAERDRYDSDTDDVMTQVRIEKQDGSLHGVMTWFSVHATSMNLTNKLISSDNLGYAAYRMEKELNPGAFAGTGDIVAAFFPANLGDASPNLEVPRCEFSGHLCDNQFHVCDFMERCFARGPGEDMFDSVKIIGTRLFEGAMEILKSEGEELTGKLAVVHQFLDMPEQQGAKYDPVTRTFDSSQNVHACTPAMGYSFASGTTDGASFLNITQGTIVGNPLVDSITGIVVATPTAEDIECHAPKPILLATGRASFPIPWHPNITSASLIWLGDLVILGVPGEPTTMAGRRMMDVVGSVMKEHGFEPRVVVSGLVNEYIHYVSTYEEYQLQRYESASTIYGPHTLDIFLNKFRDFTEVAIQDQSVPPGPDPPDNRRTALTLILPVLQDTRQIGREFGATMRQPVREVNKGDTVFATFTAGHPRHDLKQESTYFVVERAVGDQWVPVVNDADFDTKFTYERISRLLRTSQVRVEWKIPKDAVAGEHRIRYFGASRSLLFGVSQHIGQTNNFTVLEDEVITTDPVVEDVRGL